MFASDSVSLPRLDNPTGACPTHRRQWADFLVSLMAPLHRHRLRAVMFCSEVPIRDTHKSPTNCLPGCGHDPRSAPNLERHGSSKMQTSGWLEMPHFLNPISICIPAEIPECVSYNITYQRKAQYAYCGGFFLCRNRYLCEDASRISPMIVSMEFVILLCSMASI